MGHRGSFVLCVVLLGLSALVLVPEIEFLVRQYQENMASCRPPCQSISQWPHAGKQLFAMSFAAITGVPLLGAACGLLLGRHRDVTGRVAFALGGLLVGGLVTLILGGAYFLYEIGQNGLQF